jgi:hypothetical protein
VCLKGVENTLAQQRKACPPVSHSLDKPKLIHMPLNQPLGAALTQGANNTAHAASQQMLEQQKVNDWQTRWIWCHKCQGLFFPEIVR